ncbi:MAG TPA: hypothetical protein VER03_24275 [Bryobacteraceae bacterium]|nr:hypothetical protein [Bryobacteraceae bacterium]
MPRLRSRWLLAIAATVVTSVLFIDFCNLVYACGCRSLWAGADAMCNIHHAGAKHCPWCSIGLAGSVSVWLAIVGAQSLCALRAGGGWILRSALTFGAFPVVGGALAVALGVAQGYWS